MIDFEMGMYEMNFDTGRLVGLQIANAGLATMTDEGLHMRWPGFPELGLTAKVATSAVASPFAFWEPFGQLAPSGRGLTHESMRLNGRTGRNTRAWSPHGLRPRRWYGDRTQVCRECNG